MSLHHRSSKASGLARLGDLILRLARHRKGNVAVIFALSMVPMLFLCGMVLDYAAAIQRRAQLNAAADAAALAAVSAALMSQSTGQSIKIATNMFNAQASTITGVSVNAPTVAVTQSGLARTATVSYTGSSSNAFAKLLGTTSWVLSGTATAGASSAPNID